MNRKPPSVVFIAIASLLFGLWGFYSKNHPWYYYYEINLGVLLLPMVVSPILLGLGSAIGLLLGRKWGGVVFLFWPVAVISARLTGASVAFAASAMVFYVVALISLNRPVAKNYFGRPGAAP